MIRRISCILLGVLVGVWWLWDLYYNITSPYKLGFLWFCSITLLALSIGILFRLPSVITGFICIAVVGQGMWLIDYLWYLVFFESLLGFVPYLFDYNVDVWYFLNVMRHIVMIPLAFLGYYLIGVKANHTRLSSGLLGIGVVLSTFLFTDSVYNVNCLFRFCGVSGVGIWWWWVAVYLLLMIVLCVFVIPPIVDIWCVVLLDSRFRIALWGTVMGVICVVLIIWGMVVLSFHAHIACVGEGVHCYGVFGYDGRAYAHVRLVGENKECRLLGYLDDQLISVDNVLVSEQRIIHYISVPPLEYDGVFRVVKKCDLE